MKKKTIIQIIGALFVLPGFVFDLCMGFGFILNDGRSDMHAGDFLGEWACAQANALPEYLKIPLGLSMMAGIPPAAIVCIGVTLGLVFLLAYLLNGIIGSILQLPFTGKFRWITLTALTEQ